MEHVLSVSQLKLQDNSVNYALFSSSFVQMRKLRHDGVS